MVDQRDLAWHRERHKHSTTSIIYHSYIYDHVFGAILVARIHLCLFELPVVLVVMWVVLQYIVQEAFH